MEMIDALEQDGQLSMEVFRPQDGNHGLQGSGERKHTVVFCGGQ